MSLKIPEILLVDDDDTCIKAIKIILSKFPVTYTIANNGKEALNIIEEKAKNDSYFNLILMDCNMPIMDGFEASKQIRKLKNFSSYYSEIIIIALTANILITNEESNSNYDIDFFLSKPLHLNEFLNVIYQVKKKRSEKQANSLIKCF